MRFSRLYAGAFAVLSLLLLAGLPASAASSPRPATPSEAPAVAEAAHPRWGATVRMLPRGARVVTVRGTRYHAHRGVYYQPTRRGYVVVRPPVGAVVQTLPRRAVVVHHRSGPVYRHHDVYYRPVRQHGRTVYRVVRW